MIFKSPKHCIDQSSLEMETEVAKNKGENILCYEIFKNTLIQPFAAPEQDAELLPNLKNVFKLRKHLNC